MRKIIHLVPYDGIGGVETAARSMAGHSADDIEFQVRYIFPPDKGQSRRNDTFNPWTMLLAARRIVAEKPDFLIVSLWRSCLVALLAKFLSPRLRLVLFLHFPGDVHGLDRLATRYVAALACQIWADSQDTLERRLPGIDAGTGRIISFVCRRIAPLPEKPVNPVFIFWGRLHPQKGLDRALRIFSALRAAEDSARFIVIGPDGGDLARINALVKTLGLSDVVHFSGEMDYDAIRQEAGSASFYLQTSLLEGMAMSVVEAMQIGLVPVVTPAGEIRNYCQHNKNALVIQTDEAIVKEIVSILHNDARYQTLRQNAVATWTEKPLYAESVLQACMQLPLH